MSNHLLPDVDTPAVINGAVTHQTESQIAGLEPRTNGTGDVNITGTEATSDAVSITLSSALFAAPITKSYTTIGGDTDAIIAEELATQFGTDPTLQKLGVETEALEGHVNFTWPGPLSQFVTISSHTTGAEVLTNTQFSGGSGPIIPTDDLSFVYNGQVIQLVNGRAKSLSKEALAALATGPQPIK